MNTRKYKSQIKTKDLETIVTEFSEDKIDLNPIYQRDVVWNVNKMKGFINSCYRGIIPTPIMISSTDEKDICVDGKQRISTLIKFYNNDFSFKLDEDDKDEYFYSDIPEEFSEKENYHILSDKNRKRIDKLCMNILEYDNLEYVDQVQIFYRIQQGVSLKAGEKIIAMFHEHKLASHFSNKAKEYEKILVKYYKPDRNDHILFLTNVMFMIHENKRIKANERQRRVFLKNLDSVKSINKHFNKISSLIKTLFSDEVLGHDKFTSKNVFDNVRYALVYYVHTKHPDHFFDVRTMRNTIMKTKKEIIMDETIGSRTNEKTLEKVQDLLHSHYYSLVKKNKKYKNIDSDDDSKIESDTEEYLDEKENEGTVHLDEDDEDDDNDSEYVEL
ncbi:MAG: hypothetical protein CMF62_03515 [Magnetococcales bacterium]|nr:hypothetical protein [Magnetococcales bacterium]|tara:strand:- start:49908 stop:51065 length:1158 start_codon:yes stop_codon:yes gene_type:complete